jgi:hypothetical protein
MSNRLMNGADKSGLFELNVRENLQVMSIGLRADG